MASKSSLRKVCLGAAYAVLVVCLMLSLATCDLFNVGLGSKVDVTAPVVDIASPTNGSYESGGFQLTGTVTDDIGVKSVTVAVTFPSGSGLSAKSYVATVSGTSWTLDLDAAVLAPSSEVSATVTVTATDTSGKTDESPIKLYLDDVDPTLTLTSPTVEDLASATYALNGSVKFKGSADTDVVNLTLRAGGLDFAPTDGSCASFSIQVDTERFMAGSGGVTADGTGKILSVPYTFSATDAAGNTTVQYSGTFRVSQDSDSPGIDLLTEDLSTSESYAYYTAKPSAFADLKSNRFKPGATISGTVSDDDGVDLDQIAVILTAASGAETVFNPAKTDATKLTVKKTTSNAAGYAALATWSLTVPSDFPLGLYSMRISASDLVAAKIVPLPSSSLAAPQSRTATVKDILFMVTDDDPQVIINSPSGSTYTKGSLNAAGTATDALAITSIDYQLDSTTGAWTSVAVSPSTHANWSMSLSGLAEGSHKLYVRAWNSIYAYSLVPTSVLFTVDNTAPQARILSVLPAVASSSAADTVSAFAAIADASAEGGTRSFVNGVARIKGTASDGKALASVAWTLTRQGETASTASGSIAETALASWTVDIDTTALVDGGRYVFAVTVFDEAGNSSTTKRSLDVRQADDSPTFSFENGLRSTVSTRAASATNLLVNDPKIGFSVRDDDQVDSSSVEILLDMDPAVASASDWKSITPTTSDGVSASFGYSFSSTAAGTGTKLSEGRHYFHLRAYDKDGSAGFKSGKAVAGGSVGPVWFAIDLGTPAISFNQAGQGIYVNSSKSLSGNVTDGNSVASISVKLPGAPSYSPIASPNSPSATWSYSLDVASFDADTTKAGLQDGTMTLDFEAVDEFGRSSNPTFSVTVDRTAPAVSFVSVLPVLGTNTVNGIIQIRGTSSDTNPLTSFSLEIDGAAYTATANQGTSSGWNYLVDTRDLPDGEHSITARATDAAGNTGTAVSLIVVQQGSDKPEFSLVNASEIKTLAALRNESGYVANNAFSPAASVLNCKVTDDDCVDASSIRILIERYVADSDSWSPVPGYDWATVTPSGGSSTTVAFGQSLSGLTDGFYRFSLRASDTDGSASLKYGLAPVASDIYGPYCFGYDTGVPTLSITSSPSATSGTFTLKGAVYDGNKTMALSYSLDGTTFVALTGSDFTAGYYTAAAPASWTVTSTFPGAKSDGKYIVYVKAVDDFGNSVPVPVEIILDRTPPTVEITAPKTNGVLSGTAAALKGSALDVAPVGGNPAGIALVQYACVAVTSTLAESDWKDAGGANDWSVAFDSTLLAEGYYTVYARAVDKAGNKSGNATIAAIIDQAKPRAIMSSHPDEALKIQSRTDVSLYGIADDDAFNSKDAFIRQASDVYLTYSKNGGSEVKITTTSAGNPLAWDQASGEWSWTLPKGLGDGLYILTLHVTDVANNTAETSRKIQIDTTPPSITPLGPTDGISVDSATCDVTVQALDTGGVGFDGTSDVQYRLSYMESGTLNDTGWLDLPKSEDPAKPSEWTLAALPIGSFEGSKTLEIQSFDALGNFATRTIVFYYDMAPPTLTEDLVGTIDTQYANADLKFKGTASDTNALSSLDLAVIGPSNYKALTPMKVTNGEWSFDLDVDVLAEGTYTLTFTATDAANKKTALTRTVLVDRTAPSLVSVTNLASEWQPKGNPTITVKASDTGSKVAGVEYHVSADNGATYGEWIKLPSSSGTTTFSGEVVFADGKTNVIEVRAYDNAKNASVPETSNYSRQTVQVDTIAPTMEITDPMTTPITNAATGKTLTIKLDAHDDTSGPTMVYAKLNSDFSSPTDLGSANASASSGSADIPVSLAGLDEGTRKIYLRVKDAAGHFSATSMLNVTVDKVAPKVAFVSHKTGDDVNKIIDFNGTSSDINGIQSCVVQFWSVTANDWVAVPSGNGVADGTTAWSLKNFDTRAISADSATWDTDTSPSATGVQLRVRAYAIDVAGNYADAELLLDVDQNSDKPHISFSPFVFLSNGKAIYKETNVLRGTVSDDDGDIQSLKISMTPVTDWSAVAVVNLDNRSFAFDMGVDGPKQLYIQVIDGKTTPFATASEESLSTPEVAVNSGSYTGLPIGFTLDTKKPELAAAIQVDTTSSAFGAIRKQPIESGDVFGGSSTGHLFLRVEAYDANGIGSVVAKVTGKKTTGTTTVDATVSANLSVNSSAAATTTGYAVWDMSGATSGLDVTGFDNGACTLEIVATDTSLLESYPLSRTISIDNAPPKISLDSPIAGSVVNGKLSVTGGSSDVGSSVVAVYYRLGVTGSGSWTPMVIDEQHSLYRWSIDFPNVDLYANDGVSGHLAGYSTDVDGDGIYYFPIQVQAVDKAGNTTTTNYGDYFLQLDPGGDKPTVDIIYPDAGSTLGGAVRVYGSATDDDGVFAIHMMIDVDNDGNFDADDKVTGDFDNNSLTSNTTIDWFNGGQGQTVTGTNNWNTSINTIGEFNPSVAGTTRRIRIRVWAVDTKNGTTAGIAGPCQDTTIDFDTNVPKIGSSEPLFLYKGASPSTTLDYATNMYVTGDWVFGGSVEDESGISNIVISGDLTANLASNINAQWFTEYTNGSDLRYELHIPISTSTKTSGSITFSITAYDKTESGARPSTQTITINYDNAAPTATFTSSVPVIQDDGYYKVGGTALDAGSDISRVLVYFVRRSLAGSASDRFVRPDRSTSNTSYITGTDTLSTIDEAGTAVTVAFPRTATGALDPDYVIYVDHKGYAESHTDTSNNDADAYIEKLKQTSGDTYSWYADIVSTNIPDGPIEIHYVVYDEAGNTRHYSVATTVRNNGPSVSAMTLGTDLNEDALVSSGERTTYTTASASTATSFKVKAAPMTIGLSLVNGNNSVYYSLACGSTMLRPLATPEGSFVTGATYTIASLGASPSFTAAGAGANTIGASFVATGRGSLSGTGTAYPTVRVGSSGGVLDLALTASEVAAVGDGSRIFTVVLWDSTEETTPGTDSLTLSRSISCTVAVNDASPPVSVISPFYWKGAGQNSLYRNSTENGHIEIPGVIDGSDPDVSGSVKIEGTAYDDQLIRRLYARIDGLTFGPAAVSITGGSETIDTGGTAHKLSAGDIVFFSGSVPEGLSADTAYYVLDASVATSFTVASAFSGTTAVVPKGTSSLVDVTAYHRIASFASGTWTPSPDTMTSNGWDFSVSNTVMDQDSHQVAWTIDWNSSEIKTIAGKDRVVSVLAMDKGGNLSSTTAHATSVDATNNIPSYQVDVVPYIREVKRADQYMTIRSRLGRYVLRRGEAITLSGFNMFFAPGTSLTIGGEPATIGSGSAKAISTTVPSTASSGAIVFSVNGMSMPNNANDNGAAWNSEVTVSSSTDGSALWTDDRMVHVWISDSNQGVGNYGYFAGSGAPVYPAMAYQGGTLYASWSNYAAASTYYGSSDATVNGGSSYEVYHSYDPLEHTDIAYGSRPVVAYNANTYGNNGWSKANAGGVQAWDEYAPYNYDGSGTYRAYDLEELYHDEMLMQFVNERVAANGNDIHVSYYDTDTKALKYAYVLSNGDSSSAEHTDWVNLDGGYDADDGTMNNYTQTATTTTTTYSSSVAATTYTNSATGNVTSYVTAGSHVVTGDAIIRVGTTTYTAQAAGVVVSITGSSRLSTKDQTIYTFQPDTSVASVAVALGAYVTTATTMATAANGTVIGPAAAGYVYSLGISTGTTLQHGITQIAVTTNRKILSAAGAGKTVAAGDALYTWSSDGSTVNTVTSTYAGIVASTTSANTLLANGTTTIASVTQSTRICASGRSSAAGEYSAIDVTPVTHYPVIAYYDNGGQTVKLARASSSSPNAATYWTTQGVMSSSDPNYRYSGKYISMRIDASGYLHIVFYRNSTGDLVYVRSSNHPTDGLTPYTFGQSVIVDSIGSVGSGADISLDVDVPYISYYDSSLADSFNGLKMAYAQVTTAGGFVPGTSYVIQSIGTTDFTAIGASDNVVGLSFTASAAGAGTGTACVWEYMNVPLDFNVALDATPRTSIEYNAGVTKSANADSTSTACWDAAIGYKSDDYYRVGYYVHGN